MDFPLYISYRQIYIFFGRKCGLLFSQRAQRIVKNQPPPPFGVLLLKEGGENYNSLISYKTKDTPPFEGGVSSASWRIMGWLIPNSL
jgi:hypothetical protein